MCGQNTPWLAVGSSLTIKFRSEFHNAEQHIRSFVNVGVVCVSERKHNTNET
eukprot:m.389973 g.389973  ORF g.389973 m.389973 type:complete len:52 (-) comp21055_c4_seq14:266-421(-)